MFKEETFGNTIGNTIRLKKKLECVQVMSKAIFEESREASLGFELLDNKIKDKENQIKQLKQSMAIRTSKKHKDISAI